MESSSIFFKLHRLIQRNFVKIYPIILTPLLLVAAAFGSEGCFCYSMGTNSTRERTSQARLETKVRPWPASANRAALLLLHCHELTQEEIDQEITQVTFAVLHEKSNLLLRTSGGDFLKPSKPSSPLEFFTSNMRNCKNPNVLYLKEKFDGILEAATDEEKLALRQKEELKRLGIPLFAALSVMASCATTGKK